MSLFDRAPRLALGTYGPSFWQRTLALKREELLQHGHVIGSSGTGKSRFLARLAVSLLRLALPVTVIDPHGELARLILALLVEAGVYAREEAYDRILYLDLSAAEARGLYLPFNVLAQPGHSDTIAANVKDAFHRAFAELGATAATFDTLLPDCVELLVHNQLPLTALHAVLTNGSFREQLLLREQDPDLVASFRDVYDQFRSKADQISYAGSVLRRARQLTRTRVLKYGLGQSSQLVDFHRVLRRHQAVIVNLAVENRDARRLLGSLLTVGIEQAAQARAVLPSDQRYSSMHVLVDEFQLFTSPDADQFTAMLSETRKFKVFLWLAHQDWSQISARLRGAVQNAGIDVVFGLDREDSEYTAKKIGRLDLSQVKHIVQDETAESRTHPVYTSPTEQWEHWIQSIQDLPVSEAFIAVRTRHVPGRFSLHKQSRHVTRVRTLPVHRPHVSAQQLTQVQETYLQRYFTPLHRAERQLATVRDVVSPANPPRKELIAAVRSYPDDPDC